MSTACYILHLTMGMCLLVHHSTWSIAYSAAFAPAGRSLTQPFLWTRNCVREMPPLCLEYWIQTPDALCLKATTVKHCTKKDRFYLLAIITKLRHEEVWTHQFESLVRIGLSRLFSTAFPYQHRRFAITTFNTNYRLSTYTICVYIDRPSTVDVVNTTSTAFVSYHLSWCSI